MKAKASRASSGTPVWLTPPLSCQGYPQSSRKPAIKTCKQFCLLQSADLEVRQVNKSVRKGVRRPSDPGHQRQRQRQFDDREWENHSTRFTKVLSTRASQRVSLSILRKAFKRRCSVSLKVSGGFLKFFSWELQLWTQRGS